jgi:UrcA family protein
MRTISLKQLLRGFVVCGVAAWSSLFGSISPASEDTELETRSKIVWFSDLNLSHPEGVAVLYRRIGAAAHRLCADRNSTVRYWSKAEAECKRAAIANAVSTIRNDRLTALHREKTPRRFG